MARGGYASDSDNRVLARKVMTLILQKVLQPNGSDVGKTLVDDVEVQVRWKMTGNVACSLSVPSKIIATEMKSHIYVQLHIPSEEQRLYVGARELVGDDALGTNSSEVVLVRSVSDPRVTNLAHFRVDTTFDDMPSGAFTMVKKIAQGINGDVFSYRWSQDDASEIVAVKRLRMDELHRNHGKETDERTVHFKPGHNAPRSEDAMTELGVLKYLAQQPDTPVHLLKMRGVFQDGNYVALVTEFADGGELFNVAAAGRVPEDVVRRYISQISQAVEFLHGHRIAHRDISLENVLLKNGEVRLMDFGMAVRSHSASGVPLRYFIAAGKDYYRAPECYVPNPKLEKVAAIAPPSSSPGDVVMVQVGSGPAAYLCEVRLPANVTPGKVALAEPWGYAAPQADIFAIGVCLFILAFQCPAWHQARLSDQLFRQVHNRGDQGLEELLNQWRKPLLTMSAMQLMASMLRSEPCRRPSVKEALASPWLSEQMSLSVATVGGA